MGENHGSHACTVVCTAIVCMIMFECELYKTRSTLGKKTKKHLIGSRAGQRCKSYIVS